MNDCRCDIPGGGFCRRHQCHKSARWVGLCQSHPGHWRAWEEGRGLGQPSKPTIVSQSSQSTEESLRKCGGCGKKPTLIGQVWEWEQGRGPGQQRSAPIIPSAPRKKQGCGGCGGMKRHKGLKLGDHVGQALSVLGITDERVSKWLGRPCGCPERRRKLNALGDWVLRTVGMSKEEAAEELEKIIE